MISFTVPRKVNDLSALIIGSNRFFSFPQSELFQDDLYPDTAAEEYAITADQWAAGEDAQPKLVSSSFCRSLYLKQCN